MQFTNILSPSLTFLFVLLTGSFEEQTIFVEVQLMDFSLYEPLYVDFQL